MQLVIAILILSVASWRPASGLSKNLDTAATPLNAVDITQYGAIGDGKTDDSRAFLKAWTDVCEATSSVPTLTIPSGKIFLLKQIKFQGPCKSSAIHIQVEGDIVAPSNIEEWDGSDDLEHWLSFSNVTGLNIKGNGKIDGQGTEWWKEADKFEKRPNAMSFSYCDNLRLDEFTQIDSPGIHISIYGCNDVTISNLHVTAPESSPNTDGIDVSISNNVQIHNCVIGTGDDCIAIGSESKSIYVNGVACGPGHGISIGSLGKAGSTAAVEDVHVKDCSFKGSTNGARIKTWQGGSGYARKISFEEITLDAVENPIVIDQYYCPDKVCENQTSAVKVSDISYTGFHGTSSTDVAINLKCSESVSCDHITFNDINIKSSDPGTVTRSFCFNAYGTSGPSLPNLDCLAPDRPHPANQPPNQQSNQLPDQPFVIVYSSSISLNVKLGLPGLLISILLFSFYIFL